MITVLAVRVAELEEQIEAARVFIGELEADLVEQAGVETALLADLERARTVAGTLEQQNAAALEVWRGHADYLDRLAASCECRACRMARTLAGDPDE